MAISRNRAHFYVYATKVGTLWSFTNYMPFVAYEVNPHWLMGWWSLGKLSNEMYRTYLLKCKRSFKTLLQNYDAVVEAERAAQLQDYQLAVAEKLQSTRLPFRAADDPPPDAHLHGLFCLFSWHWLLETSAKVVSQVDSLPGTVPVCAGQVHDVRFTRSIPSCEDILRQIPFSETVCGDIAGRRHTRLAGL